MINLIKKKKRTKICARVKFILLKISLFSLLSFLNEISYDFNSKINNFDGNRKELFDSNYIYVSDKINKRNIYDIMRNNSILKLKIKNNGSFFKHLLLLSGDIAVNPGPVQFPQNPQKGIPKTHGNDKLDTFEILNKRGLHFIHVNINSILPKIEEIRHIAYSTNLSVIGISESKLDSSVNDNEIGIPGFDILRKDRNRNGGGVLAYIRNDISFNVREDLNSVN